MHNVQHIDRYAYAHANRKGMDQRSREQYKGLVGGYKAYPSTSSHNIHKNRSWGETVCLGWKG